MATSLANPRILPNGRRRHSRLRVQLAARLITLEGTMQAMLVDLSFTGAKIALNAIAPKRGDAVLEWASFEAFCTIAWAEGQMCGVVFEDVLASQVLLATRALADATGPVDSSRVAARGWATGAIRL